MRLVDSHAHLQAERFADDREEVIASARAAGVERMLVPGWDVVSCAASVELARRHTWLRASAGVHPHDAAAQSEDDQDAIESLAGDDLVVAIGETGLDYDRELSPRDVQLASLRRHIGVALATGKPLILHCRSAAGRRDAQDALLRELTAADVGGAEWRERFADRPPGIVHSYSGPVDYAEGMLALGLAVSFSGLVFRRREEASAEVARLVPGDRLLVETDSPYLPPPGANRRRNEPRYVDITARWVAMERDEDPDALGVRLVENYDRIVGGGTAA